MTSHPLKKVYPVAKNCMYSMVNCYHLKQNVPEYYGLNYRALDLFYLSYVVVRKFVSSITGFCGEIQGIEMILNETKRFQLRRGIYRNWR